MPKISDVYAGDFVNASELPNDRRVVAVIARADVEEVGQGDQRAAKVTLTLQAPSGQPWPRKVVLNKGNSTILAKSFGDEILNWPGRMVELWKEPVNFQGRAVDGIKMAAPPPPSSGIPPTAIAMPGPAQPATHMQPPPPAEPAGYAQGGIPGVGTPGTSGNGAAAAPVSHSPPPPPNPGTMHTQHGQVPLPTGPVNPMGDDLNNSIPF